MRRNTPQSIRTLSRQGRQWVINACLLPVSFVKYPFPGPWLAAARQGRIFFSDLLQESDALLRQLHTRSAVVRTLAGWPLRFARQVRRHSGVLAALRWNLGTVLNRLPFSGSRAMDLSLCTPGPVALIEGLAERRPHAVEQAEDILYSLPADPVSITEHVVCRYGQDDFADTTTVVLAHWDPNGQVPAYVQHMGRHFRSLGWKVVLASAAPVIPENKDDLPAALMWPDAVIWRTCPGYDVTSWKAALQQFPSLYRARELILNNDSVFGAIGPYAPMHNAMEAVDCDFWGITESREITPHVQSYHLVFRAAALTHPAFKAFFDRIPLSSDRSTAIVCETRLALWLAAHGLKAGAFVPLPAGASERCNPILDHWQAMIEAGVPLIKRELMLKNPRHADVSGWRQVLERKEYPLELIEAYAREQGVEL